MFWPGGKWRDIEQDVSSTIMQKFQEEGGLEWGKR